MMSAYAQFTFVGDPRTRTPKAAQNIHYETRPPATTKRADLGTTDTGFKGLLNNSVEKARSGYVERFMTLDAVRQTDLYQAAAAGLPVPAAVNYVAGQPYLLNNVLTRAFTRHNDVVAARMGAPGNAAANAARFRQGTAPALEQGAAALVLENALGLANRLNSFGYVDEAEAAAAAAAAALGAGMPAAPRLTALRTYDVMDPEPAGGHECHLVYPGIAEHMALCLYRASDMDMRRPQVPRTEDQADVSEPNNTTVDGARPLFAFDSGPQQGNGGVPYSHAQGQMTLRQWQDWTILQIAHMERVEMLANRGAPLNINMAPGAAGGDAPDAVLDTGGLWCQASNHLRRNVLMALLYSRTDDELHAQTLFGYDYSNNIQPTCAEVDVAVHYDSRCDVAVIGADNVYTYLDNGIVRANVHGEAIFMKDAADETNLATELPARKVDTFAERSGKTLFVIGKEVTLPLLQFEGKYVVDLRPDTVVPGLYMKGHDELRGEELIEQVPTVQLYEAPDITAAVQENLDSGVVRYRQVTGEPDPKDATLLRTQSVADTINDAAGNAGTDKGRAVVAPTTTGVHGSDAAAAGTLAFRRLFPLQFPVYPTNFRDRSFPLSGDGTPGSIDRIVARYSYHVRADFARRSFTGMTLPITILPGALGPPAPALGVGTAPDNRIYFAACANAGYGAYGLPGPSSKGFKDGCRAVVATLNLRTGIDTVQLIRNPRQMVPTAVDLASAMSRRGRHNEVGIAMQSLLSDRQGDIMLHDGV